MISMLRNIRIACVAGAVLCSLALARGLRAQDATAPKPADPAAAEKEPVIEGQLRFQVRELSGKVRVGKLDAKPDEDEGWHLAEMSELVGAGLKMQVPMRGALKLVAVIPEMRDGKLVITEADPPTVVMIEKWSLVQISESLIKDGAARTRWQLGYGAIRAGVAEGVVRSDMEIECPVAVLSKKGTDIFRFEYRNHKWNMSLSDKGRGMIQAFQNRYNQQFAGGLLGSNIRTRFVTPGQFVTQEMLRTIDNVTFNRPVNIVDAFGLVGDDLKFTLLNNRGFGTLLPGGNPIDVLDRAGRPKAEPQDANLAPGTMGAIPFSPGVSTLPLAEFLNQLGQRGQIFPSRDGSFGIGTSTVPVLGGFGSARQKLGDLRATRPRLMARPAAACRP